MHEHGMHHMGMMQQQETPMMEMWNTLSDDQKKTLMKRMVDAKIMMKEAMLKEIQFRIETMHMVRKMLDVC
ncbi:MAG: hypothetical protein LUQ31_10220 [Methanoregula sp.]|nr:hypothetical protein [Methanoregula sp.]